MSERRVWGIHMVRLGLDPIVKGYAGIGWMQLGDLAKIPPNREAFKAAHMAARPEAKPGATPLVAGMLLNFVHEMQPGDVLVYPCRDDRMIYLGEVVGTYQHVPGGGHDPNRRAVRWVKALPRSAFPETMQGDFAHRRTLVELKGNAGFYLAALEVEPTGTMLGDAAAKLVEGTGQGFGPSPAQRRLVELRAMAAAAEWLRDNGFDDLRDVAATASCDYVASRAGQDHVIEVKGTTGDLGSIVLTANEVALHRDWHSRNLLIVVHGITLSADSTQATGGEVSVYDPWIIDEAALTPTAYNYDLAEKRAKSSRGAARAIKREQP